MPCSNMEEQTWTEMLFSYIIVSEIYSNNRKTIRPIVKPLKPQAGRMHMIQYLTEKKNKRETQWDKSKPNQ